MNSLVVIFCLAISAASAVPSVWWNGPTSAALVGPSNPGVLLKGPADGAKVVGPDGSVIIARAQADSLWAAPQAGGVIKAAAAPGAIGLSSWSTPVAVRSAWAPNAWASNAWTQNAWAQNAWAPSARLIGVGLRGW